MTIGRGYDAGASASCALDFVPVPLRARRDGWTPEKQRAFIGALRATRSVSKAARAVGMSRESAYRLRERPGAASLVAVWNAALAFAPSRGAANPDLLWHRAIHGVAKPIMRGGEQVGMIVRPDNRALLKLYDRFDRLARNAGRRRR